METGEIHYAYSRRVQLSDMQRRYRRVRLNPRLHSCFLQQLRQYERDRMVELAGPADDEDKPMVRGRGRRCDRNRTVLFCGLRLLADRWLLLIGQFGQHGLDDFVHFICMIVVQYATMTIYLGKNQGFE